MTCKAKQRGQRGGRGRCTSGYGVGLWSESSGVAHHLGHFIVYLSKTNLALNDQTNLEG